MNDNVGLTDQTFAQGPKLLFERSGMAELGAGELCVVMARAGVGKTACLVQGAIDELLAGNNVFHVAHGEDIDRVQAWYDTLLRDRKAAAGAAEEGGSFELLGKRMIHTVPRLPLDAKSAILEANQLENMLQMYAQHTGFSPDMIIMDGFDWAGSTMRTAAILGALKALAGRHKASLWTSAQTHRDDGAPPEGQLPAPCQAYVELIDCALHLLPREDHAALALVKDRSGIKSDAVTIQLQTDTMRVARTNGARSHVTLPAGVCTLLSGGAAGAEETFGSLAARWGLNEIHYSFAGRPAARERGLVMLTDQQLQLGSVSDRYLEDRMHRNYPKTPLFRKVLQSIWHQVNTANQVFVVGMILEDGTVKGGTGWAAELAKHLDKSLHVYDQERRDWLTWTNEGWDEEEAPRINARRFTGTGTRHLSEQGRQAIEDLFERSFGRK